MSRKLKIALVCAGAAAVFFAVSGVVIFKTTSHSNFCNSCHIMEPYYQSWQRSKHKGVECTACHMPPHIKGKLLTKFEALSQLAKYVTRTYGTRPWGRIGDDSCTECHKEADLLKAPLKEFRKGVYFSHAPHLKPEVRHRKLKCTTCHTQVDRNNHMEVMVSACYTCHFKPDDAGGLTRQAECASCHARGAKENAFQEAAAAHRKILIKAMAPGSDCRSCHQNVVRGNGEVPEYRCYQCHNSVGEVQKQLANKELLHDVHVSRQGVQCNNCHLEIVHKKPKTRPLPAASDCRQCHGASHDPQFSLFSGTMTRGGRPSGMFLAGMQCASCHRQGAHGTGPTDPKKLAVKPESCQPCHSARVKDLWRHWVDGVDGVLRQSKAQLDALIADPKTDPRAMPELKAVEMRLTALSKAHPVHNLPQSRRILEDVDDRLRAVASPQQRAGLAPLPHRVWDPSSSCLDCHFTVGNVGAFSHDAHGKVLPKKTCTACHADGGPEHGAIVDRKSCTSCHHPEPAKKEETMKCDSCHQQQRAVFAGKLPGLEIEKAYGDKSCTDCHDRPSSTAKAEQVLARCSSCHDPGYDTKMKEALAGIGTRLRKLPPVPAQLQELKDALDRDASGGAHHPELYRKALELLENKK